MDNDKILELARRHTSPIEGELDGGTVTYWEFWEEELLAFAQAIIEAERDAHGITVPIAVWDKLKDVNTVRDLIKALHAAEEGE